MLFSLRHAITTYLVAILKTSVAQAAVLCKKFPVISQMSKCKKRSVLRSVSCWLGILPAITAFVEATAGMILFTTPKIQIQ